MKSPFTLSRIMLQLGLLLFFGEIAKGQCCLDTTPWDFTASGWNEKNIMIYATCDQPSVYLAVDKKGDVSFSDKPFLWTISVVESKTGLPTQWMISHQYDNNKEHTLLPCRSGDELCTRFKKDQNECRMEASWIIKRSHNNCFYTIKSPIQNTGTYQSLQHVTCPFKNFSGFSSQPVVKNSTANNADMGGDSAWCIDVFPEEW